MYNAIQPITRPQNNPTGFMAAKGMNLKDLPQLLDINFALLIRNYISNAQGQLEKRKGYTELFNVGGTDPITMLEKWTEDLWVFSYGTTTGIYRVSTGAITNVKTDWSAGSQNGQQYGDYFFVCNGTERIYRLSQTLAYDAETVEFTLNRVVRGATSGATATVLELANYTPAFLTGDTGATAVVATWNAVTNGSFRITIDGTLRNVLNLNFASAVDMDDVAAIIQAGIRNLTKSFETVVWSTNRFIITSANRTSTSAITVTSAAGSGTDISGAGGTDFMDCDTGNGVVTNAVNGTTGTLTLGGIVGTFLDNEVITETSGVPAGSATVNGTLTFVATEIPASPKASTLAIIQGRILCDDADDSGILNYSAKDDTTNPPFNDWTVGTDATDAGRLTNRNIGRIRSIVPLGQFYYVLGDTGEFAFYIETLDSAGVLTKTDQFVTSRTSLGGARGAITTDQGIFLANEAGLWQTVSLGQQDVPFSKQSQLNSINLGKQYFEDVDFSNSDIAYDEFNRLILVTCAKDSIENNLVIVYNIDNQSFAEFTGWNFTRFMVIEKTLYAGSTSGNAVYKLFDGNTDGEFDITTLYIQEVNGTPLNYANWIKGAYFQGFLSDSSAISVNFDKFTRNGIYVPDAAQFLWTASGGSTYYDEYGSASYGASGWGGAGATGGLVDDFTGCRPMIRDFQRIRVRITETSQYPHTLNWFSLLTESKTPSRRVNMARITT